MYMVISCHFVQLNPVNIINLPLGSEKVFLELEFGLGQVGVDLFFFITAWFLSDPAREVSLRGSLRSLLRFWLETAFYSYLLCLMAFLIGAGSPQLLAQSLLPIAIGPYWYATAYAVFLLLYPFVSQGLRALGRNLHLALCLLCFALWTFPGGFLPVRTYNMDSLDVWFLLYLYVLFTWWRWYGKMPSVRTSIVIVLAGLAIATLSLIVCGALAGLLGIQSPFERFCVNFGATLPVILVAFGLFLLFVRLDFKNPLINTAAASTYSAYLLHNYPAVQTMLLASLLTCGGARYTLAGAVRNYYTSRRATCLYVNRHSPPPLFRQVHLASFRFLFRVRIPLHCQKVQAS